MSGARETGARRAARAARGPAGPARLAVRVSPGASRTEWVGRLADGRWKARLAAPPEGGRANRALVDLVARTFAVDRRDVRLVAGAASRDKILEVRAEPAAWERFQRGEPRDAGEPERGRRA